MVFNVVVKNSNFRVLKLIKFTMQHVIKFIAFKVITNNLNSNEVIAFVTTNFGNLKRINNLRRNDNKNRGSGSTGRYLN